MIGLKSFQQHFQGLEKEYVIIGGTACELLMAKQALTFRTTKDVDMVLLIESVTREFGERFWKYVQEAGYRFINKGTGKARFYRFSHPKSSDYPMMIELFSKRQDWFSEKIEQNIAPIHIDDEISSLSAILLDEGYYEFLKKGTTVIDGISVLKAEYIIPFKAKAFLDLTLRKERGEQVDSRNIKKHKNDIFRLFVLLTPQSSIVLTDPMKEDFSLFIQMLSEEEVDLKQFGILTLDQATFIEMLGRVYGIPLPSSVSMTAVP